MTERYVRYECIWAGGGEGACAALAVAGMTNGQAWDMLVSVQPF